MPPADPSMGTPAPNPGMPPAVDPMAKLPLSAEDLASWRERIEKARDLRKRVARWWAANLKKYAPDQAGGDPEDYSTELNTNRDFTLVERKKADLFYQSPRIQAVPSPLLMGQPQLLDTHTDILNEKLGPFGVNAKPMVHRVLFDVLCPSGTGWTVMGYESVTVPVDTTHPQTMQPYTAQVPLFEDCYWTWFSPKQALVPHDFKSTDWDSAPWLGMEFEISVRVAKRKGWVPEDFVGAAPSTETHFDHGTSGTPGEAVASCVLIVYKSAQFRDDVVHPQHQTHLILVEGVKAEPAEHKNSPHQRLDDKGALEPNSLVGFPIHPLTIRTLTDSSYVPSDCTISRPLVNELNDARSHMVLNRKSQLIVGFYDAGQMTPQDVEKMVKAPINGLVGLPSDVFNLAQPIKPLDRGQYPRENFSVNDYLDNDLSRTHAVDAEQSGADSGGDQTATEASIKQSNVSARLGFERGNVLDWYVKGVTKFSAILQWYLPIEQAVQIVGPQKAQEWDSWRKTVPAHLAFSALPDSALRTDLAVERKRALDEYSFFANDPLVNRGELLKAILPRLHYPMTVLQTQPPEKGPEPPKLAMSVAAADLDPMTPAYGNIYQVLTQLGIKNLSQPIVDPVAAHAMQAMKEAAASPNTAHGGKVPQTESLSKHAADETGAMQGTGSPAATGPGGAIQ
jgi:hypothetical protein